MTPSSKPVDVRIDRVVSLGHLVAVLGLIGTMLACWRALEVQAIELRKDQASLREQFALSKQVQDKTVERLEKMSENQVKVATLLDAHLAAHKP